MILLYLFLLLYILYIKSLLRRQYLLYKEMYNIDVKNTIFNVTLPIVDDLEVPMPSEENDVVDIDSFWNKMETSLVERGLAKGN